VGEVNGRDQLTEGQRWQAARLADTEAPRNWPTNAVAAWNHERAKLPAAVDAGDREEIKRASAALQRIRDNWGGEPSRNGTRRRWGAEDPPSSNGNGTALEALLLPWSEYRDRANAQPQGDYIVPNLYRRGQSSLLVGEPKAGKSTLCRRIAVVVAKGGTVLGYPVEASTSVYMPLQEDPRHVVREVEKIDSDPGVRMFLHNPDQPMEWERLASAIEDLDAALLIVDMLADFKTWEDGNDYVEMKAAVGEFTRLARETHCHVLLVHHGNKTPMTAYPTARVHGSAAIAGEVDVVASVHRDPKKGRIYQAEGRGIGFFERGITNGHT